MTDSPLAILQAANLYVYTMNNPIRWIDPSGLKALDPTTQALRDRFIATEYGGRVNAREYALSQGATVTNLNGGGINISHNGISQNFNLNNNGTFSFNALNSIFNWNAGFALNAYSERMEIHAGTFHHAAGTEFFTESNARLAWGLRYHPQTTATLTFYSWLFKNPRTGLFFYGTAINDANGLGRLRHNNATHTAVGWIHTHPITGNPSLDRQREQFSGIKTNGISGDGWFATEINAGQLPGYLITPSAAMRRLDPSWQRENIGAICNYSPAVALILDNIFSRQG